MVMFLNAFRHTGQGKNKTLKLQLIKGLGMI